MSKDILKMYFEGLKELSSSYAPLIGDNPIFKKVGALVEEGENELMELIPKLESYTYYKDDDVNGNIFHIANNIERVEIDKCDVKTLVKLLKMSRIDVNGKAKTFNQKEILTLVCLKQEVSKKELSEIILALETQFGKYHTKDALTKVKYDTDTIYDVEHMDRVVNFATSHSPLEKFKKSY